MQNPHLNSPANPPQAGGGSPAGGDKYVYVKARVMFGPAHICVAASTNMARRISNALNARTNSSAPDNREFSVVKTRVVRGTENIALAPTAAVAQLIAAALNFYEPGARGY